VKLTPIVEEIQYLAPEGTSIDIPTKVQEQLNQDTETLKEVEPENTKEAPKFNGMEPNLEETIKLDESQTTISYHPLEGTLYDVM
jgi:Zn-dependent M32 family carboxypeptidase